MKLSAMSVLFVLSASATYAVTPEQCAFFQNDGKTAICHATGSARNPYVILRVSEEACVAHAEHSGDYLAVNDPTCNGQGCLPVGAPCDATLPCCDGSACASGACEPVAITASDVVSHIETIPVPSGAVTCSGSFVNDVCDADALLAASTDTICQIRSGTPSRD